MFAPNSDSYVSVKLNDTTGEWNFSKRVAEFAMKRNRLIAPSYVDDITGGTSPIKSISEEVIDTVSSQLGLISSNAILVVGSDQIASMRPHIKQNRSVCVLRPGYVEALLQFKNVKWFSDAVHDERLIITSRKNMVRRFSSTAIRIKNADNMATSSI